MATTIPRGSLIFSGYGQSPMKFLSPLDGTILSWPLGTSPPIPNLTDTPFHGSCKSLRAWPGSQGGFAGNTDVGSQGCILLDPYWQQAKDFATTISQGNSGCYHVGSHGYGAEDGAGGGTLWQFIKFAPDGSTLQTWNTSLAVSVDIRGIAVNDAETILYYFNNSDQKVYAWDLVGNTLIGVFVNVGHVGAQNNLLCCPNGDVIIGAANSYLKRFNSAGTLQLDYSAFDANYSKLLEIHFDVNRSANPAGDDTATMVVSYYSAAAGYGVGVARVRISDGAVLSGPFAMPNVDRGDTSDFEWDGPMSPTRVDIGACLPAGSLVFGGFGQGSDGNDVDLAMLFYSPAGLPLRQPPGMPGNGPGDGVDGICTLSDGKVAIFGGNTPHFGTTGVGIYNPDFSIHAQGAAGAHGFPGSSAARDANAHSYALKTGTQYLFRYDGDGNQLATWQITDFVTFALVCGVNAAGTIAYIGGENGFPTPAPFDFNAIYAHDLVGDTSLGLFKRELTGSEPGVYYQCQSIFVRPNGNVVVAWDWRGAGASGLKLLREYDSSGATVRTYSFSTSAGFPIWVTPGLTDASFWCIFYNNDVATSSGVTVAEFSTADGSVLHSFAPDNGLGFEFDSQMTVLTQPIGCVAVVVGGNTPTPVIQVSNVPQKPCDPQAAISGGARGQFGCNPGGVGWTSSTTGPYGSAPAHADPADGEDLSGKAEVDIWIEHVHTT